VCLRSEIRLNIEKAYRYHAVTPTYAVSAEKKESLQIEEMHAGKENLSSDGLESLRAVIGWCVSQKKTRQHTFKSASFYFRYII